VSNRIGNPSVGRPRYAQFNSNSSQQIFAKRNVGNSSARHFVSLPSLLLCVLSLAIGCGDPADEDSYGSEDSDGSSGGTSDGELACASSIPTPLPQPGPEVHGWEPTDIPTCGNPQVNTEPPPCIGTNCVEVVFCTDCFISVNLRQLSATEILVVADGRESSLLRITELSVERIRPSVELGLPSLDEGDLLGWIVGEAPHEPAVFVRVSGNTGGATALVEFFHGNSDSLFSTQGRAVARNDPNNNGNWSLCSIPQSPGVSEFMDFIPNPMDEVRTTSPGRPFDYQGDVLWRSRRYDGDAGMAFQMWEEVNGNGPSYFIVSGDWLFGSLRWLRASGGYENHLYRYDLTGDELVDFATSLRVSTVLGASGVTGQLIARGVDDINVSGLPKQLYRVDPSTGEETLLLQLDGEDNFGSQGWTGIIGDHLYFVRSQAPGCLERIRISP